jgi:hypothetical protein
MEAVMGTDYRRKAKHLRYTSNAFFTLACLTVILAVAFTATGQVWLGLAVATATVVLILAGAVIELESRRFAWLGKSQSRMTAWNRRAS